MRPTFSTMIAAAALVLAFDYFLAASHVGLGPEVLRGGPQSLADPPAATRAAILP